MVSIAALWLPILLSAVFVFIMSSLIHMVFKWHKSDYKGLPDEDAALAELGKQKLAPGLYTIPHCADMSKMGTPEVKKKYDAGPVGFFSVMPNGLPNMGKFLSRWFAFTIVVGIFVAYLTGRHLGPGADYLAVFRLAGTIAFAAYAMGEPISWIWKGQPLSNTLRHMFDGLLFALLTGGTFGWLWPS